MKKKTSIIRLAAGLACALAAGSATADEQAASDLIHSVLEDMDVNAAPCRSAWKAVAEKVEWDGQLANVYTVARPGEAERRIYMAAVVVDEKIGAGINHITMAHTAGGGCDVNMVRTLPSPLPCDGTIAAMSEMNMEARALGPHVHRVQLRDSQRTTGYFMKSEEGCMLNFVTTWFIEADETGDE